MSLVTINQYSDNIEVIKILKQLNQKLDTMANSIADLTKKVDALQQALDTEQEQIAAALARLQTTIDELRASNGTEEERQALADKLDAIKADIEGTIADTPTSPQP